MIFLKEFFIEQNFFFHFFRKQKFLFSYTEIVIFKKTEFFI
jgi:hypothetical protein